MEISLRGKRALVGGSTSGIGQAIAIELAQSGANVVLMARNKEKLERTLASLDTSKGQQHSYIQTDFNDYDNHRKLLTSFFETQGVDILVNNTQGPSSGNIFSKTSTDYQRAFELLFQQAVLASSLAIQQMKLKGYGRIINVSSMTVREPSNMLVLSNTMRTALVSWSKSLATEVAKDGITVNSILTGSFDTDRLQSLMEQQANGEDRSFEEVKSARIVKIPVNRLGDPKEYGYLATFLASEYASFLTGTAIPLDGGASVGLL